MTIPKWPRRVLLILLVRGGGLDLLSHATGVDSQYLIQDESKVVGNASERFWSFPKLIRKNREKVPRDEQPVNQTLAIVEPDGEASQNDQPPVMSSLPEPEAVRLSPRIVSLNIMVAGLSGLGKTTTCAALMDAWCDQVPQPDSPLTSKPKSTGESFFGGRASHSGRTRTRTIKASRPFERYDPSTNTVLRVRFIDTPGFGNRVNHRNAVRPVQNYIAACRNQQFRKEMSPQKPSGAGSNRLGHFWTASRSSLKDDQAEDALVHVCLYFFSPGRFLEMDRHFLKQVEEQVVIIPIIAKADTLTDAEISQFRSFLYQMFHKDRIRTYNLDAHRNPDGKNQNLDVNDLYYKRGRRGGEPLAIVSRDGIYPWGKSRSWHPDHSDLKLVRDILLSYHTQEFVQLAQQKYALYSARRIYWNRISHALRYTMLVGLLWLRAAPPSGEDDSIIGRLWWTVHSRVAGVLRWLASVSINRRATGSAKSKSGSSVRRPHSGIDRASDANNADKVDAIIMEDIPEITVTTPNDMNQRKRTRGAPSSPLLLWDFLHGTNN